MRQQNLQERISERFSMTSKNSSSRQKNFFCELRIDYVSCKKEPSTKVTPNAFELECTLPGTQYEIHFKGSVVIGSDRAFIFFSNELIPLLVDVSEICFDETFLQCQSSFTNCGQYLLS